MSPATVVTFFPIKAAASFSSFSRRPLITTCAPSSTKRLAVANPIPLFPPVISFKLAHDDSLRIRYSRLDSWAVDGNCPEVHSFCLFVHNQRQTWTQLQTSSERCTSPRSVFTGWKRQPPGA